MSPPEETNIGETDELLLHLAFGCAILSRSISDTYQLEVVLVASHKPPTCLDPHKSLAVAERKLQFIFITGQC